MSPVRQRARLARFVAAATSAALLAGACAVSAPDMMASVQAGAPTAAPSVSAAEPSTVPGAPTTPTPAPSPDTGDQPTPDPSPDTGDEPTPDPSPDTGDEPTPEPSTQETPGADASARFVVVEGELPFAEAQLVELIEFVEDATGRPFRRPPRIAVQSFADFEAGLQPTEEDIAKALETAEVDARYLQALGHTTLSPRELLDEIFEATSSADLILGYFDPEVDTLYVPSGGEPDSAFESVLVHELVHALDNQYANLQALLDEAEEADRRRVEGRFELFAVAEGRASAVQRSWGEENPSDDEDEQLPDDVFGDVPPVVLLQISLPYELGELTIAGLGGPDDTWWLYNRLPDSSEQAMFIDRLDDPPLALDDPTAEGPVLDRGVFGAEAVILWLLGHSLDFTPEDAARTLRAANGWSAGSWVLWGDARRSCVRADVAGDTPTDLAELADAFEAWENGALARGVEADAFVDGDRVRVTACSPFVP